MKKLLTLLLLWLASNLEAQNVYFPPLTGTTWQTITPAELGWCEDSIPALIDYVGENNSKAFLLLKDGKMVIENYYGTFTRDSLWYWASAGKSLTGFMVGMAQEQGMLNINNPSSNYLGTGWTNETLEQEAQITVRNQLSMTSGLDDDVDSPDCTIDTCLVYAADPGTRWAYHNAPYTLLDGVMEGATGNTINQFYSANVRTRLGMGFSAYIQTGYNNVMYSSARAFARFGLMVLNRGVWNQDTLMHDLSYFDAMTNTSQNLNLSYGYLWWLNGKASFMLPGSQLVIPGSLMPNAPDDMFSALGKNCQYLNVVPSKGIVLVRMGNAPNGLGGLVPTVLDNEIWRRLNIIMCENPTALDQSHEQMNFNVFPNPSSDRIQVEASDLSKVELLELVDLQGRILATSNTNELSVLNISSGNYFLRVTGKKGVSVKKMQVTR
jgi:CubicO group peptidase (beta-lactamase class C family)